MGYVCLKVQEQGFFMDISHGIIPHVSLQYYKTSHNRKLARDLMTGDPPPNTPLMSFW